MNDDVICGFMNKTIYDEIIPTLDLPQEELKEFAAAVTERFKIRLSTTHYLGFP